MTVGSSHLFVALFAQVDDNIAIKAEDQASLWGFGQILSVLLLAGPLLMVAVQLCKHRGPPQHSHATSTHVLDA